MNDRVDVLVIGAGPAGSSTALRLARTGAQVLLVDRKPFPRDKSCGDGLTPYAVRLLHELGVGPKLAGAHRVDGVTIAMRGGSSRDFSYKSLGGEYDHGLVVPRLVLDEAIRSAALAAGARFETGLDYRRLLWDDDRIVGAEFASESGARQIMATAVVGASGAASTLRRDAGLEPEEKLEPGFALRGYFDSPHSNPTMVAIVMPLTDPTNTYVLPSYGWVFPIGAGRVNLGVGLFEDGPYDNVRDLYHRFVSEMTQPDGLAPGAVARGKPLGAALRFDFSPQASARAGLMLVGDAAGLVSPFTGEGISYALESAKLAAEAIGRYVGQSGASAMAAEEYSFLVGHKFSGYFEAGRKSARRYQLIWHVIESTFDSDRPIYGMLRRLALVPEGAGSLMQVRFARDLTPLMPPGSLRLKQQLFKVGARLAESLRQDWPFLSRLELEGRGSPAIIFRPSLLFLAAASLGAADEALLIDAASALDLSYLAMLAQTGVEEEQHVKAGVNWGNKFSVLLSDFLLAKALSMTSDLGLEASALITQSFEMAYAGLVEEQGQAWNVALDAENYIRTLERKLAPLFVLPCMLAAELTGQDAAKPALARYGSALGLAFAISEDVLALSDAAQSRETLLGTDYARGHLGLAAIETLASGGAAGSRVRDIYLSRTMPFALLRLAIQNGGAIPRVEQRARAFADRAAAALTDLPESPGTTLLGRIASISADIAP